MSYGRQTAEEVARACGGASRTSSGWICFCPGHANTRTPALSIRQTPDGRLLWHCFSECSWEAVRDGFRRLGIFAGSGSGSPPAKPPPKPPERSGAERTAYALEVWRSSSPAAGTLVEVYLKSRSLHLPPPPSLRFHADLKHTPSGKRWPAMVALVQRASDGEPLGIHRTYLRRDGAGKAPIEKAKMALGPLAGGAVFLAAPAEHLAVSEGIETGLAAMQASGIATWAALSTSGFRGLTLPSIIREVIVLADADEPGEAAAMAFAHRWTRQSVRGYRQLDGSPLPWSSQPATKPA